MRMQAAVQLVYPPQCLTCDALVTTDFGLCAACWRETPFVSGLVCDCCGVPLPGEETGGPVQCDDCLAVARPWSRGRAALLYRDNARKMVMALKHGDRVDLARPAAGWLHRAARPLLAPDTLIAPVPLHWTRLIRRRYNQSALLAAALGRLADLPHCPDLLIRRRNTRSQEGRDRSARFVNVHEAFRGGCDDDRSNAQGGGQGAEGWRDWENSSSYIGSYPLNNHPVLQVGREGFSRWSNQLSKHAFGLV